MKLQTRLLWVVLPFLALAVMLTALALGWSSRQTILRQAREDGEMMAAMLGRSIEVSQDVEQGAEEMITRDLTSSAQILSHFVAVTEHCRISPAAVNQRLHSLVNHYNLSEISITDSKGKIYLHSTPGAGLPFLNDPVRQPQHSAFWPLLQSRQPTTLVQDLRPRDLDGHPFKYVAVSGLDRPRIVQVGLDGHMLTALRESLGVQELLNHVVKLDAIDHVWVVGKDMEIKNFADEQNDIHNRELSTDDVDMLRKVINTGSTFSRITSDHLKIAVPLETVANTDSETIVVPEVHNLGEGEPQKISLVKVSGAILLHMPTRLIDQLVSREMLITGITVAMALSLGTLLLVWFTRRLVKPVTQVTDAASALQAGTFDTGNLAQVIRRPDEVGNLARVFQRMATELLNQKDILEQQVRERTLDLADKNRQLETAHQLMQEELSAAHALQQAILPARFPSETGFTGAGMMQPARNLAGDFYDFIELGGYRVGVLIADVSDKGVTASFFMAITRTILRDCAHHAALPGECLREANRRICASNPMLLFVTVLYGVLDTRTGEFTYSNGGHLLPYLFDPDAAPVMLEPTGGALLGISEGMDFGDRTIVIKPGQRLFFYSDGITEAFNSAEVAFGDDLLIKVLAGLGDASAEDIVQTVIRTVHEFAGDADQSDDITAVALARIGPPA